MFNRRSRNALLLFFGLISQLAQVALAQSPTLSWKTSVFSTGITNSRPGAGKSLAVDAAGNVFVTGESHNGSDNDFLTIKYNAAGVEQWRRFTSRTRNDSAMALAVDSSGNIYVTGSSTRSTGANLDFLTVKFDTNGNELWRSATTGASSNSPAAIAVATDGSVFVTGSTQDAGFNDAFLTVKLSANGSELWRATTTNSGGSGSPAAIVVDAAGNAHVTGYDSNVNGPYRDILTIKYDPDGAELWRRSTNGSANGNDRPYSMALDGNGNVLIAGESTNANGDTDFITVKLNASGVEQWRALVDGDAHGNDQAVAIAVDTSGNVYTTGSIPTASGLADYVTLKYNATGIEQWRTVTNGAADSEDRAADLALDTNGNVFVTGSSNNANGDVDYLTVKLSPAGAELWRGIVNTVGGPSFDFALRLVVDAGGAPSVTGAGTGFLTVRYSATGIEQWRAESGARDGLSSSFADQGQLAGKKTMAVDGSGNVFVAGLSIGAGQLVARLNASGVQQWRVSASFDDVGAYAPAALAADGNSNVIVAGSATNGLTTVKYNGVGAEQWRAVTTGTAGGGTASAVAVDAGGSVYVTGSVRSSGAPFSHEDFLTIKYSSNGVEQWRALTNGSGVSADRPTAIALDAAGNVYVTGTSLSAGNNNYLTIKYNAAGAEQWRATLNGAANRNDTPRAIAVDGSGNVYVTGESLLANIFGGFDVYEFMTVKYNGSGAEQWRVTSASMGNSSDQATALAVDGSGIYVTGTSFNGGYNALTIKYNASGVQQWRDVVSIGGQGNSARAMTQDGTGNVYIAGTANEDYFALKYSPAGVRLWDVALSGTANTIDEAFALAVDPANNVYLAGTLADFGSSAAVTVAKFSQAAPTVFYTVTPSAGANGSIAPSGVQMVASGSTTTFTVTPDFGYEASVGGTCGGTLNINTGIYTTANIAGNCTVIASFTRIVYTVTVSIGANGSVTPNVAQLVAHGDTVSFTVTPNTGYRAIIDSSCNGSLAGNVFTTLALIQNCNIAFDFELITYTATPSADANGRIFPTAAQTLAAGATTAFTVVPDVGYRAVVSGTCGGTLAGAIYTITPLSQNCTVVAGFAPLADTVVVSTSGGTIGSGPALDIPISINGLARNVTAVTLGLTATHSFIGDLRATLSAPGGSPSIVLFEHIGAADENQFGSNANLDGSYIFGDIFPPNLWTAAAALGDNDVLPPSGYRAAAPFTGNAVDISAVFAGLTPAQANGIWHLQIFDRAMPDSGQVSNVKLAVTMLSAGTTYTVTPSAGAGGSISPTGLQTVTINSTPAFVVTPNAGFIASVGGTCGGTLSGSTYTTNPVVADCTVIASFAPITYTVTASTPPGANGSISPSGAQAIAIGTNATFTVLPASGFAASMSGTCGGTLSGNLYTTSPITSNCSVIADFVPLVIFNVVLEGAQETPPVSSAARGSGSVIVNTANNTLSYSFDIENLTGTLTGAHFHGPATRGSAASIKIDIGASPEQGVVTYGEADEPAIVSGLWYVNFHTSAFAGGELRGQLDNLGSSARTLTIAKLGAGSGRVASSPAGIDCGSTCSFAFAGNAQVTLTAIANPGSIFAGWSGGICSGIVTCQVTMSASQSVNATFLPLNLTSVRSRKNHGAAGEFDLPIDTTAAISGLVTVEPRAIGNGHRIVFRFDQALSLPGTASVVDAGNAPLGTASTEAVGNEIIVTLAGVPDNRRATVFLTGVNGNTNATASLGFLIGDVNNSRTINAQDSSGIKARAGQLADQSNFRFDLNASGRIGAADIAAVKARAGLALP